MIVPTDSGLRRLQVVALALGLMGASVAGCDDTPAAPGGAAPGAKPGAAPGAKPGAAPGAGSEQKVARELPVYRDEDFIESERNRDPFRSYMSSFGVKAPDEIQRQVVMPTTPIEEMNLIAIISGTSRPKAMLVDPLGVGHVVERGMFVGRPQVIQATGSISMTLNWRIDRIRENEVVFTRQDPVDPGRPPLTRVLALHEELASR